MQPIVFTPKDLDQLEKLARIVASSGMFPGLGGWEQAATIIATGFELGLTPMLACRNIRITREGGIVMSADIMAAICLGSDKCERFECETSTDELATWVAKRKGGTEQRMVFSLDDARQADLYTDELPVSRKTGETYKTTWHKYTRAMLNARAKSGLARMVFSDLLAGVYDPEELESVTQPEVASPKRDKLEAEQAQAKLEAEQARAEDQAVIRRLKELAEAEGRDFCKSACEGIDRGTPDGRRAAVICIETAIAKRDELRGVDSSGPEGLEAETQTPEPVASTPSGRPIKVAGPRSLWNVPDEVPIPAGFGFEDPIVRAAFDLLALTIGDLELGWEEICLDVRELFDVQSPFFLHPEKVTDLVRHLNQAKLNRGQKHG